MKDWKKAYRAELIQVAAVAIAAIQDFDQGNTNIDRTTFDNIVNEIFCERQFQFHKWGSQHHTPFLWNTILGEEVGETCEASLEWNFNENTGENRE